MPGVSPILPHNLIASFPASELADLEFQPREQISEAQNRLLTEHLRFVSESSPFYRSLFREYGIRPEAIRAAEDLAAIPCTEKSHLASRNAEFLAVPESEIVDVCLTSASASDTPCALLQTASDLARLAYNEEAAFRTAGIQARDTMLICAAIDRCFMAGLAYFLGGVRLGARLIRAGSGSAAQQWQMLKTCGATVLTGVPSLMRRIGEYALENGIEPAEAGVSRLIAIGEQTRDRDLHLLPAARLVERMWDAEIYSTYASTEIATSFCECPARCGGHLRPELIVAEIVDDAGKPLPPGNEGEIVVTPLGVRGMPLVRFRTGDISFLMEDPCPCGRRTPRLAPILGRKNQMLKFKGTTVFPNAIVAVLEGREEVAGAFVEAYKNPDGTDRIVVYVQIRGLDPSARGWDVETAEKECIGRLEEELRARIRVVPEIRLVSETTLNAKVYESGKRKRTAFFDFRDAGAPAIPAKNGV